MLMTGIDNPLKTGILEDLHSDGKEHPILVRSSTAEGPLTALTDKY
jgi:hypothetical protein